MFNSLLVPLLYIVPAIEPQDIYIDNRPPIEFLMALLIVNWLIIIMLPLLLLSYIFKSSKTPFYVCSIIVIIISFANINTKIIYNLLKPSDYLIAVLFYVICLLATLSSCYFLHKFKKSTEDKKYKRILFGTLIILLIAYLLIPHIFDRIL